MILLHASSFRWPWKSQTVLSPSGREVVGFLSNGMIKCRLKSESLSRMGSEDVFFVSTKNGKRHLIAAQLLKNPATLQFNRPDMYGHGFWLWFFFPLRLLYASCPSITMIVHQPKVSWGCL